MRSTAERRWKTRCIHKRREIDARRRWYLNGDGTMPYIARETPTPCSCPMCSYKNSWRRKSEKRRMRNGEHTAIREFYNDSNE